MGAETAPAPLVMLNSWVDRLAARVNPAYHLFNQLDCVPHEPENIWYYLQQAVVKAQTARRMRSHEASCDAVLLYTALLLFAVYAASVNMNPGRRHVL